MTIKNIIDVQNTKFIVTNTGFFGIDCTNPRAKLQIGDNPDPSTNPILLQVADTLTVIKEGNKKRVGINKYPEDDLDIDGNIRISSSGKEKITFYDTSHDHEHGKLLFTDDDIGSQFEVFTKNATTSNVEQTFTINNKGAIGIKELISTNPNFGTDGQFLISKGTGQSADWITLQGGTGVTISPSNVISIGQSVSSTSDVTFNSLSIGSGGMTLTNTNLVMANSTISINANQGTPGQTLTSNGTNPIYWADKKVNLIWTPYFEPFGLANIGGLVTMDNQRAYYSSFYTSSALSYDKIILYTTESTVSFTGRIGVGIFDSNNSTVGTNNSTVGTNKLQEAIVEYTNVLSSGEEILINFPSSVTLDSNTKYWVGIAVDSTNILGIAKAASVDTDNIHIRKEVSANFDSSGFGSVVSTTNSDLNFWYRLYNSQITSFNDFTDRPDSLSIFKTNGDLLEAKIETETEVSGTGSAILFETLDSSNVLTEKLRINSVGAIGLHGSNYGNAGAVLTSQGSTTAPIWSAPDVPLYKLTPNTFNASNLISLIANDFTEEDTWWYDYKESTFFTGPDVPANQYFFGGVLAPNKKIILVPFNSLNVGIYDPYDNTYQTGVGGLGWGGRGNFAGGVLAPDGKIVFVPHNDPDVVTYYPNINRLGPTAPTGLGLDQQSFWGGVLAPNGLIIFAPYRSANVGIYDPSNNTYSTGVAHGQGLNAFAGAVLAPDGRVILIPYSSPIVAIYDPNTDTIDPASPTHGQGGAAFVGGVLAPNGQIVLVPNNSLNICVFDPPTNNVIVGTAHAQGTIDAFRGGALAPNGKIIMTPSRASAALIYDITTDTFTLAPPHNRGFYAYKGAVLGPYGKVIFIPDSQRAIGIYGLDNTLLNEHFDKNILLPYFNKF